MNQETITYLTNIVIGVILAALTTNSWRQRRQSGILACWTLAAWIMTAADVLFAARPILSHELGRVLPTACVTIGHAVLLLGARRTAGLPLHWRLAAAGVLVHVAGLVGFLFVASPSNFRMVFNGMVWSIYSISSAVCLYKGAGHFWKSVFAPASAFIAHAAFHGVRIVLAVVFAEKGWKSATDALQIAGDLEVSFFMVALFVGLLMAHLQLRHEELMSAKAEVETLSGLLPICAWCKKVRDDDGYWQQVEEYFSRHSRLRFTHGVCMDCLDELKSSGELVPRK